MRNMIFTPPSDDLIKRGVKDMTARWWRIKPPSLSETMTASTGRRKETRFAEIKVVGAFLWDPRKDSIQDIEERTGYTVEEIAKKEGFDSWYNFLLAYHRLNHDFIPDDPKRLHFFIEFEVVRLLNSQE